MPRLASACTEQYSRDNELTEQTGTVYLSNAGVTLGIFLLLAARNPSANRSLIAFGALPVNRVLAT